MSVSQFSNLTPDSDIVASQMHRFDVGERSFAFLVPSSMIVELDTSAKQILDSLSQGPRSIQHVVTGEHQAEVLRELAQVGAVERLGAPLVPLATDNFQQTPPPLSTIVLNVTNTCNLSCSYCYEYGDDRIESPAPAAQAMELETARQSIDMLIAESGPNRRLQVTFFGGETLLNWKVIRPTVEYARKRAAEVEKFVDFSLTTNATVLTKEISEWLADNHIGVTVSIDGPPDVQDAMRVFKNGRGSYDVVAPRIRELLRIHTSRPIGARVTLTSSTIDVPRIFDHLTREMGFYEVGFAPVTSSTGLDYAIDGDGFDRLLAQFKDMADRYVLAALAGNYLGFANLTDMLSEIHRGAAKAYPCGAGIGLLGVAPGGEVGLCHRFAGAGDHDFGHVATGVDVSKRAEHLQKGHIANRTDCSTCWARSLCSGGCYHEAQVRYGDRFRPNLHYCDWIREWTALGLDVYGRISVGNPAFFERFVERKQA